MLSPEVDLVLVVGSKNSSNSSRLVDRAIECGTPGHLIDDASELRPEWFAGVGTVLVTAGASAPEHLVEGVIGRLIAEFDGRDVDARTLAREDISFALPKSARQLAVIG